MLMEPVNPHPPVDNPTQLRSDMGSITRWRPVDGAGRRVGGPDTMVTLRRVNRAMRRLLLAGAMLWLSLEPGLAGLNDDAEKALAAKNYAEAFKLYSESADGNDAWGEFN